MQRDIMSLFQNFMTGSEILRLLLYQVPYLYKRFCDIVRSNQVLFGQIRDEFVPISTITVTIREYNIEFT